MKLGGTGGANTNRGGLEFEKNTDLSARIVRDLSDSFRLNLITVEQSAINSKDHVYEVIRLADDKKSAISQSNFSFIM